MKCAKISKEKLEDNILNLPLPQQEAIKACVAASKVASTKGMRYSTHWVYECLLIRIKSRKTYEHLRTHKILALPSLDTLNRYIRKMDSGYGFHRNTFDMLKKKAAEMTIEQRRGIFFFNL